MIPIIRGYTTRNWLHCIFSRSEDQLRDAILETLCSGRASAEDLRVIAYIVQQTWVCDSIRDKRIKRYNERRRIQRQIDELVATGMSVTKARKRLAVAGGTEALRKKLSRSRNKRVQLRKRTQNP